MRRTGTVFEAGGHEVQLPGGTANRGLVVRVGDTVRRPQTATSPGVHALLRHLEDVGFDGAPRFLGVDEAGREVLSYVEGDAAIAPHAPWALTDDALDSVALLLRRYHDAVAGFQAGACSWPDNVPVAWRSGLISHNDPNLDNVVFREERAVALIDFDLASPGSALWDVAMAARLWVPLRDPRDIPDDRASRLLARLRRFADAYGLPLEDRARLVATARATHDWCYDLVRDGAQQGRPGFLAYWTMRAQAREQRGRSWLEHVGPELGLRLAAPDDDTGGSP